MAEAIPIALRLPDRPCTKLQRQALLAAPTAGLITAHKLVMDGLVDRGLADWADHTRSWVRVNDRGRFYITWLRRHRTYNGAPPVAWGMGPETIRVLLGADESDRYRMPRCSARVRDLMYARRLAQGMPGYAGQHFLTEQGLQARVMLQKIAERYRRGQSSSDIAAGLDVTARTVQRWLTAMGVELRRVKLTDKQRDAIAAKYLRGKGASLATLAAEYDVSTHCIKIALKGRQVPMRKPGWPGRQGPPRSTRPAKPANREETRHS
jgi:transposase